MISYHVVKFKDIVTLTLTFKRSYAENFAALLRIVSEIFNFNFPLEIHYVAKNCNDGQFATPTFHIKGFLLVKIF